LFALALACLGIYGVISYIVSQRLREMGLRIALGARRLDIVCEVLGRAARLAIAGLAAG
jgi:putative ABC transport system permease protein